MAIVRAVKTGVWSDPTVWNTGALPTAADDVYSNTFTVTIDVSPTVLSIQNRSATGVTAGGGFTTTNGITITCTGSGILASTVSCVVSNLTTGQTCTIVSNAIGGTSSNASAIANNGNGTLNAIGTMTGGSITAASGAINNSGGILNVTGDLYGSPNFGDAGGVEAYSTGTVNITGNCYGPNSNGGPALRIRGNGVVFVTGSIVAGSGGGGSRGVSQTFGTLTVTGPVYSSTTTIGIFSSGGTCILSGPFFTSSNGYHAVNAERWFWANSNVTPTYYQIRTANLATIRPLYTADSVGGNPATSNVRSGTVYGPAGELTGTCAVPPAGSVALGVPVDATTGTAAITAATIRSAVGLASANLDAQLDALPTAAEAASAVRSELSTELGRIDATVSSRLAPGGTLARVTLADTVTTLTNAPDVPTEAEIATAVRTELSTELGRIDASTSSRLAAVAYTAPPSVGDIAAAVWAAATRTLTTAFDSSTTIAAAVWSAATRTLTSSSAPSAADNAAAVWGYSSGRTVTGGTVDTVTNSTPVDAGEIADAVRTELTPELARLSNAATTQEVGDIVEGALAD